VYKPSIEGLIFVYIPSEFIKNLDNAYLKLCF
jgi:hypothetical protein